MEKERLHSLDILRIVATVIILLHHYQQITGLYFDKINFFGGKFPFYTIVEFFFILSGVFTYKAVKRIENGQTFSEFYINKMIRLLPLCTISCVVYEVILHFYNTVCHSTWLLGNDITVWGTIISALGLQAGGVFRNPSVNNPIWYISVLLLCYAVTFLITNISIKRNIPNIYLFVFMIFLGLGIQTYQIDLPFLNADSARGYTSFFLGILLAKILLKKNSIILNAWCVIWAILITLIMVFNFDYLGDARYIMIFVYYPAIICLFNNKVIGKIFDFKIVGMLGKATYDIYIWHIPVILLFYIIDEACYNIDLKSAKLMFIYVFTMFFVGILSHYILEKPILNAIEKYKITHNLIMVKGKVE